MLSGLGAGARWPNSTPAFVGAEEEEEVATLAVGAPGLVRWSRKTSRGTTALGDSSERAGDSGGRGINQRTATVALGRSERVRKRGKVDLGGRGASGSGELTRPGGSALSPRREQRGGEVVGRRPRGRVPRSGEQGKGTTAGRSGLGCAL